VTRRTEDALAAVGAANDSLSGNVNDLLGRLSESNARLGDLIETGVRSLDEIDGRITETTTRFASDAGRMAETFSQSTRIIEASAENLERMSSGTLERISAIAGRFDEHGSMLAGATELLDQVQGGLTTTLDERQNALEALVNGLVKKSEEVERVMKTFETLVGQSVESAQFRTRDTAERVKQALAEVVEAATSKFAGATEEMRETANRIRAELEETRSDLRKGVFDLPEE